MHMKLNLMRVSEDVKQFSDIRHLWEYMIGLFKYIINTLQIYNNHCFYKGIWNLKNTVMSWNFLIIFQFYITAFYNGISNLIFIVNLKVKDGWHFLIIFQFYIYLYDKLAQAVPSVISISVFCSRIFHIF